MTSRKILASLRDTLDFLNKEGEVITIGAEIDPVYEIAGVLKTCDNGPALLLENIKGYPGVRVAGNVYSRAERLAKLFGTGDYKGLKFKCWEAIKKPLPPREVSKAPCQEVVITRDIDVMGTLPIFKHTKKDGGRVLGGGVVCLRGEHCWGGSDVSYKRMHFRGKDWGTILARGGHIGEALVAHKGKKVPVTVNIGTPPAIVVTAAGGSVHTIIPQGSDELAIAGAIQGSPIEVTRAKTVEAYSIANSEWVLEGYIDTTQRVWETEEAEKIGGQQPTLFFPEWPGYVGTAMQVYKLQITAITHRQNPIFLSHLTHTIEHDLILGLIKEACFYELTQRMYPGLVVDVNIPPAVGVESMVVLQVKKRDSSDEGLQRNIINACLGADINLRLIVVVDEDVDIYSADDILWAIVSRVNSATDIVKGGDVRRRTLQPIERVDQSGKPLQETTITSGAIGMDATVPFGARQLLERTHYPVDDIDINRWLSEQQMSAIRAMQNDYARVLARTGS